MANSDTGDDSITVKDVRQLGIWAALASLSYVFWVCGALVLAFGTGIFLPGMQATIVESTICI